MVRANSLRRRIAQSLTIASVASCAIILTLQNRKLQEDRDSLRLVNDKLDKVDRASAALSASADAFMQSVGRLPEPAPVLTTEQLNCKYSGRWVSEDYACPGDVLLSGDGWIDASGNVHLSVQKTDGGMFATEGDYYVYVFDPTDGNPSNHCQPWNVVKARTYSPPGPLSISLPAFKSNLVCGGPMKAYCVAKAGFGYKNAWCSNMFIVQGDPE